MFDVGRVGWIFILRGVLALLFAQITFSGLGPREVVFAFGLYWLLDGVFTLGTAFRHADEGERPWWALVVGGFASLAAGLLAMGGVAGAVLVPVTAGWAIVTGGMWISAAVYLRKHIAEEWMLAGSGVLSALFGVTAALFFGGDASGLATLAGGYAFLYGLLLVTLGMRLRTWMRAGRDEFEHRFSPASQYYVH